MKKPKPKHFYLLEKTNDDPSTNEKLVDTEDVMPNLLLAVPEIGANAEVFGIAENINLDEYTKDLDTSSLDTFDINLSTFNQALEAFKDGAKNKIKTQRARIIINDFSENESVIGTATATMTMANDLVTSDDDYEDDIPCGMDDLILPNSNTDRNAVNRLEPNCRLCSYQVTKGYKQLTKHYVRKHPKKEIPISRLAQAYNPQELMINPITPLITNSLTETLIQSICFICDESYNMSSSKWVMHFITHTGKHNYYLKFTNSRNKFFLKNQIFLQVNSSSVATNATAKYCKTYTKNAIQRTTNALTDRSISMTMRCTVMFVHYANTFSYRNRMWKFIWMNNTNSSSPATKTSMKSFY